MLAVGLALQTGAYVGPRVLAPKQAQLPEIDKWQYFTGRPAGTGIDQAALADILAQPASLPPLVIAKLTYTNALAAYFDRSRVKMLTWQDDWAPDLAKAMLSAQTTYVVEVVPRDTPVANEPLPGVATALLASYARRNGDELVRVRQVVSAGPAVRARFFEALCVQPARSMDSYQAVAQFLATQASTSWLLLYPPNQLASLEQQLARQPGVSLLPIGDSWPLDRRATAAALQLATDGRPLVRAILLNETACDPARFIETWLAAHLFRIDQRWLGPARLLEYAPDAGASQIILLAVTFGRSINLERVDLIDSKVAAGGFVRLRLVWRSTRPISQSLKVFVHVFNALGIVAQHDGLPAGDLMPTTGWAADQTIYDQFAILLPVDAADGDYQIRIGLYDADTQARVPAELATGAAADYFVGGQVTVAGTH